MTSLRVGRLCVAPNHRPESLHGRDFGSTCGRAQPAAFHVDRSKIFARERLEKSPLINVKRVTDAIECTRFPPLPMKDEAELSQEPRLVQAADLIGQLGDPLYSRKANALFWEFEEIGMARRLISYLEIARFVQSPPDSGLLSGNRPSVNEQSPRICIFLNRA